MKKGEITKIFKDNLFYKNPVVVQILGICSTLAVTNFVKNTLVMCFGLIFTTTLSNLTVSILRKSIPSKIRLMVETLIIASYVIVIDIILKTFLPDISRQLGPYVGLIITNCIVLGRTEAFALSNPPLLSLIDGFSSGLGYSIILITISIIREVLGMGTVFGFQVLDPNFTKWTLMVMAPGGFFVLALLIWFLKAFLIREEDKK
ncbi:MAG: NADH:ubiquinone reductase (Na(+)-transporting) subunit D [Spirochaetes bacterium]|nr:NADH:ubiquinone reductase (Na(+)-transporting) subunit D [Spirochaetota bacterium]